MWERRGLRGSQGGRGWVLGKGGRSQEREKGKMKKDEKSVCVFIRRNFDLKQLFSTRNASILQGLFGNVWR